MKKTILISFLFASLFSFGQVPQRFNKVIVTGDITSPKYIVTNSNNDSVLLGAGGRRAISTIQGDTTSLSNRINSKEPANSNIQSHISSTSNPHSVTKAQIGLGNVDNTSDVNKPVSTAQSTAIGLKVTSNTAITGDTKTKITYDSKGLIVSGADINKNDIGLDQVNNTSDANKPVSTATQTALNLKRDKTEIGDAHGFVNPPNSGNFTVSNTGSAITLSLLSGAGNYKINGTQFTNTGLNLTFNATIGQNFISINSSGLFKDTGFFITDLTKIPCCTVNFDGTNITLADELHTSARNLIEHQKQHDTDGTRWVNGLAISFGAGALNTFSSAGGVVRDEDRYHTIAAKTSITISYRNSALTAMTTETPTTTFAKLIGGIAQWDNNGVLTNLTNNNYGVCWIYATNRVYPTNSELVSIIGQGDYGSISLAQSASQPTLVGMNVAEWKLLYRVIIRRTTPLPFSFIQADDLRLTTTGLAISGTGLNSLPAGSVTFSPFGNISSTDVQSAIQELDSEKQPQLNGTGFVKVSGTTISYDNSTYEPAFSKNTGFNKNFGTTTGTVLEGRTFGTAAGSAIGDFQPAITGLTTGYLSKWTGASFANSMIIDNGTLVDIKTGTDKWIALRTSTSTGGVGLGANIQGHTDALGWQDLSLSASELFFNIQGNQAGKFNANKDLILASTTPSSSPTTGALVIGGGIGVGGKIYATGFATATGTSSQYLMADGSISTGGTTGDSYTCTATGITGVISPSVIAYSSKNGSLTKIMIGGSCTTNVLGACTVRLSIPTIGAWNMVCVTNVIGSTGTYRILPSFVANGTTSYIDLTFYTTTSTDTIQFTVIGEGK